MAQDNLWKRGPRWAGLTLVVLSVTVYLNAIPNGFVLDDILLISRNERFLRSALQEREWWPWLGRPYYWGAVDEEGRDRPGGSYRPVTVLTHVANLRLFGLDPAPFHAVNVGLHAAVTLLVFALGRRYIGTWAAFLGTALFAVHPLHTEAVTGIVGRAELLAALFGLGALLCALRAGDPAERRWPAWAGAAVGLFALSLLSKEHVATLPVWLYLALVAERRGMTRRRWGLLAAFGIVTVAHLALWRGVVAAWGGRSGRPDPHNNPAVLAPLWGRWLTAAHVVFRYAWLFVWPRFLSADYSYAEIPVSQSVGWPEMAGILVVGLVVASIFALPTGVGLLLALAPVTFFVVSNVPFAIGTIMGERLTYLPSAGVCLMAGWAVTRLAWPERLPAPLRGTLGPRIPALRWTVAAVVILALVGYGARTARRNLDWRDHDTLMLAARAVSTRSAKMMLAAAAVELRRGHPDRALPEFEAAMRVVPESVTSDVRQLHNLAAARLAVGQTPAAIDAYRMAAALPPSRVELHHNLAYLLWSSGRRAEAEDTLRRAIGVAPGFVPSRLALGALLLDRREASAASDEFQAILRLDGQHAQAREGLALASRRLAEAATSRDATAQGAGTGPVGGEIAPRFFTSVLLPGQP